MSRDVAYPVRVKEDVTCDIIRDLITSAGAQTAVREVWSALDQLRTAVMRDALVATVPAKQLANV